MTSSRRCKAPPPGQPAAKWGRGDAALSPPLRGRLRCARPCAAAGACASADAGPSRHRLDSDLDRAGPVHDAARPCLTLSQLETLINELVDDEVGGLLAVPVADTLKRSNTKDRVTNTESRENLWQAQTPQMFRYDLLTKALQNTTNINITDDASAVEALGFHPKLVPSDVYNFKVTYPQDLALAELILQKRKNL